MSIKLITFSKGCVSENKNEAVKIHIKGFSKILDFFLLAEIFDDFLHDYLTQQTTSQTSSLHGSKT